MYIYKIKFVTSFAFFINFTQRFTKKSNKKVLTLLKSDTLTKKKNRMTFVGSYTFNEKKKTLYKLLLTVNFKLVVMDIIMMCLLLLGLTCLMRKKQKQKHYTSFY